MRGFELIGGAIAAEVNRSPFPSRLGLSSSSSSIQATPQHPSYWIVTDGRSEGDLRNWDVRKLRMVFRIDCWNCQTIWKLALRNAASVSHQVRRFVPGEDAFYQGDCLDNWERNVSRLFLERYSSFGRPPR
ncbi:hypothetical protein CEXT_587651 [Caerostris extrusa]|uniref:Uncharacterized protein n=1 Tax=Caerostris extrusa TaxID=172846 RepID=A0AAV4R597_CAEEX|nr:hypothetical protein CEXT_587651 [Caerostris extrusa]